MIVYTDGSVWNHQIPEQRRAYVAFVVRREDGDTMPVNDISSRFEVGSRTSNEAEYIALIFGLRHVASVCKRGDSVRFCSDSELMVNQVNGKYKIHKESLRPLRDSVEALRLNLQGKGITTTLSWVSRDQNLAGRLLESG